MSRTKRQKERAAEHERSIQKRLAAFPPLPPSPQLLVQQKAIDHQRLDELQKLATKIKWEDRREMVGEFISKARHFHYMTIHLNQLEKWHDRYLKNTQPAAKEKAWKWVINHLSNLNFSHD